MGPMLIAPNPANILKDARTRLGLTQYDLAEKTRIARSRISSLERGVGLPSIEEQRILCPVLGIAPSRMAQAAPTELRPRLANERKGLAPRGPYEQPRDRPSEFRYRAAWKNYPDTLRPLELKLQDHPDLSWLGVYLRDAVFDSGLEMLASLHLLAAGARPGWVSPQSAGFVQLPIVDPITREMTGHHPYPALAWEGGMLFPQVSLRGRRQLCTVDLLMGMKTKRGLEWIDVEIDGRGHDTRNDDQRADELGLLVVRFETSEIVDASFIDKLRELTL